MDRLIESPADWRGPQLAVATDWIHVLTPGEITEIDQALRFARSRGRTVPDLTRADFPLPTVPGVLAHAIDQVENGRGLHLLRGFPAERYNKDDLRLVYWGLGLHMGTAVSQSSTGDLLGDVRNLNVELYSAKGRGYTSNEKLSYHTDFCDVVCLFVLRIAQSGGLSIVGSSIAIHNEIARQRPDLLDVLYQPYYYSWQGQEVPGEAPYYKMPIFSEHAGKFACIYVRSHILSAQRFPEVPRLTAQQLEAIDLYDALAASEAFSFSTLFLPGDLQIINNYALFHSRTAFEDHPESERRRHLLRLWLAVANSRALSPGLSPIFGSGRPGVVRGGFPSRTGQHVYETTESVT